VLDLGLRLQLGMSKQSPNPATRPKPRLQPTRPGGKEARLADNATAKRRFAMKGRRGVLGYAPASTFGKRARPSARRGRLAWR
jgi:hypothetical protein